MISLEKSNLISHQTLKVQFPNFPDHLHQTVQPETGNLPFESQPLSPPSLVSVSKLPMAHR